MGPALRKPLANVQLHLLQAGGRHMNCRWREPNGTHFRFSAQRCLCKQDQEYHPPFERVGGSPTGRAFFLGSSRILMAALEIVVGFARIPTGSS